MEHVFAPNPVSISLGKGVTVLVRTISLFSQTIFFFFFFFFFLAQCLLMIHMKFKLYLKIILTHKMPRKPASKNVCLCHLLNILANLLNLFLHTGKQCGP